MWVVCDGFALIVVSQPKEKSFSSLCTEPLHIRPSTRLPLFSSRDVHRTPLRGCSFQLSARSPPLHFAIANRPLTPSAFARFRDLRMPEGRIAPKWIWNRRSRCRIRRHRRQLPLPSTCRRSETNPRHAQGLFLTLPVQPTSSRFPSSPFGSRISRVCRLRWLPGFGPYRWSYYSVPWHVEVWRGDAVIRIRAPFVHFDKWHDKGASVEIMAGLKCDCRKQASSCSLSAASRP